jgi:hypothetical protein
LLKSLYRWILNHDSIRTALTPLLIKDVTETVELFSRPLCINRAVNCLYGGSELAKDYSRRRRLEAEWTEERLTRSMAAGGVEGT